MSIQLFGFLEIGFHLSGIKTTENLFPLYLFSRLQCKGKLLPYLFSVRCLYDPFDLQKKKEEEKARDKELNDLFKIAVSQPKVPLGMYSLYI